MALSMNINEISFLKLFSESFFILSIPFSSQVAVNACLNEKLLIIALYGTNDV